MKYSVQMHGYKYAINGYLRTSTEELKFGISACSGGEECAENTEDSPVVQPHRLSRVKLSRGDG